jgi:hypothetical protein
LSQPAAPVQSEDLARDLNTSPPEIAASSLSSGAGVLVAQPDAAPASSGAASENAAARVVLDALAAEPARRASILASFKKHRAARRWMRMGAGYLVIAPAFELSGNHYHAFPCNWSLGLSEAEAVIRQRGGEGIILGLGMDKGTEAAK